MAYFNFILAEKNRLLPLDVISLQLIKQNKIDAYQNLIENTISLSSINSYEELGLITYIKGKPSQSIYEKIRLTKKGVDLLDLIETPDVEEDDIKLLDWLIGIYESEDKMIGNKKRIASGIANFRVNTGIRKNNLALLLRSFINDENTFEFSQKLENVFFNAKNLFQRRFVLDDCKLYEYYLKNKDYFEQNFK